MHMDTSLGQGVFHGWSPLPLQNTEKQKITHKNPHCSSADLGRAREPKTQVFATTGFGRFTPSPGNSSMWREQETAENCRFSQKTAGNRRLGFVTLGPSPLARPYYMIVANWRVGFAALFLLPQSLCGLLSCCFCQEMRHINIFQRAPWRGGKRGGRKTSRRTPLPKKSFGPRLVRFPAPEVALLCFSCTEIND